MWDFVYELDEDDLGMPESRVTVGAGELDGVAELEIVDLEKGPIGPIEIGELALTDHEGGAT